VSTTPRIDSSTGAASVTHPAEMDGSSTDLDYYKALLANVDPHSGEDGLTCHERFGGTWIGRAGQGGRREAPCRAPGAAWLRVSKLRPMRA
jgi:hypothetical protein